MARQDLLDQGRPGAVHPNNKDRARTRVSPSLALLEELPRKGVADECGAANDGLLRCSRIRLVADFAAALDMADRPFVLACGIQRLGEREMKRDLLLLGKVAILKGLLHFRNIALKEIHVLEVCKCPPG